MIDRRRHDDGFTLMEVVAALVIVTVTAAALMQGLQLGARGVAASDDEAAGVMLARSLLARAGTERPLDEGVTSGTEPSGFSWQLAITPYDSGQLPPLGASQPTRKAFWVSVGVTWQDARRGGHRGEVRLTTIKLGGEP